VNADQIADAAQRCGCSSAEMTLCLGWMDDHGAPCEWDKKTEADYKKALDALRSAVAR
jgi:hypothetical protein